MPAQLFYGEPDWTGRPFYDQRDEGYLLTPTNNKSYEEIRLSFEERFCVPSPTRHCASCSTQVYHDDSFSLPESLSARQMTFLRWSQSPLVKVLVGPEQQPFQIPADFLTRRSGPFCAMLDSQFEEAFTRTICLPETAPHTFQHVMIWAMSPQPRLDPHLPISVVVDIAIFATIYLLPALLHQALDILRAKAFKKADVLTPELLKRIYSHVDDQSLLRHFTRAALTTLSRSWPLHKVTDEVLKEWQDVIEHCPTLGFDFFAIQVKGRSFWDPLYGGDCRFHRHSPQQGTQPVMTGGYSCSRVDEECFEEVGIARDKRKENIETSMVKPEEESGSKTGDAPLDSAIDDLQSSLSTVSIFGSRSTEFGVREEGNSLENQACA